MSWWFVFWCAYEYGDEVVECAEERGGFGVGREACWDGRGGGGSVGGEVVVSFWACIVCRDGGWVRFDGRSAGEESSCGE